MFDQTNYSLSNNINNLNIKIVKIFKKIIKLNITIEKMVTIKSMNNLSVYLKTILSY